MSRIVALLPIAATVLMSACATPPAPPTNAPKPGATHESSATVPPRAGPAIDWPAERARIAERLRGDADITARIRDDGALQLVLAGADAFAANASAPRPALQTTLDRIAPALAAADGTELRIYGHTDSIGSELYNLRLSIQRAEAVMEHLRRSGISLTRLHADGRGEAEPVADNATEAGRARNRRIEIIIEPLR